MKKSLINQCIYYLWPCDKITSKLNGSKHLLVSVGQEGAAQLHGSDLSLSGGCKAATRCEPGMLSSDGLTGVGPVFEHTHVAVGKPQLFAVWAWQLDCLGGELPRGDSQSFVTQYQQWSYHLCCIFLVGSKSVRAAHASGKGITQKPEGRACWGLFLRLPAIIRKQVVFCPANTRTPHPPPHFQVFYYFNKIIT